MEKKIVLLLSFLKHINLNSSISLSAGRGTQLENECMFSGAHSYWSYGLPERAGSFPACFRVTTGNDLSPIKSGVAS